MVNWKDINIKDLFTLGVESDSCANDCMTTSYSSAVVMMMLSDAFEYNKFLEIGTWAGYVSTVMSRYFYLKGRGVVHTVDPTKRNSINEQNLDNANVNIKYFEMTSDEFFKHCPNDRMYDLIFIDGDHMNVYNDFKNSILHLSEFGTMVLHDAISMPITAKLLYEDIGKFGEFEVLSFNFHTGYSFVRRSNKAEWKKLGNSSIFGHQPKKWIDLNRLFSGGAP